MSVREWPEKTQKFFQEVKGEMQKVSWPNRQSVIASTVVVLVVVSILALCIFVFDFAWGKALSLILGISV
jgi:preprotein translocase subunit SecE